MSEHLHWDPLLIQRYNRAGPRYTSYPTALEFAPVAAGQEAQILAQREASRPLSLYVHIPFCAHLCYYCACNKIVTKKRGQAADYLAVLKREIHQKAALLRAAGRLGVVEQVHFGGGTPTFFSDAQLSELWQCLREAFEFSTAQTADFSIEIDPRELRPTTLATLKTLGFNRLSFGVQDIDPVVQKAVNRVQPLALVQAVMQTARGLGFGSINIDLIYGLPHQTVPGFAQTVAAILALQPDRLSVFNYAHLPDRFFPQTRIAEQDLPSAADKLAILGHTIGQLNEAGYHYVGMDHFARPEDELARAQAAGQLHRNFQGYTTHGQCDLLSFGVSSISQIGRFMLQNPTELDTYTAAVLAGSLPAVKVLAASDEDLLRRAVIMPLLCHGEVDFAAFAAQQGVDFRQHFAAELAALAPMQADGLVTLDDQRLCITERGRLLSRNVAMVFDAYLQARLAEGGRRFSRVI